MTQAFGEQPTDAEEPGQSGNALEEPAIAPAPPDDPAIDIAAIRELVLRAHPNIVSEMVTGDTVDALLASVEPAEAAFQRISASFRTTPVASSPVPAGGDRAMPVDPARIPASEKIRRGLSHR